MAKFFEDLFNGSAGTLNGRTPDTAFGSQTWVNGSPGVSVTGGYAIGNDQANIESFSSATYGAGGVADYGQPTAVFGTFIVKTGPSVAQDPTLQHTGFFLSLSVGETSFGASFYLPAGTSTPWQVMLGATTANAVTTVTANTEYTGTFLVTNGLQRLTLLGCTITTTTAFTNSLRGLNAAYMELGGGGIQLMSLSLEPAVVGVAEVASAADTSNRSLAFSSASTESASVVDTAGGTTANYPVTATEATTGNSSQSAALTELPYATLFRDNFDGSGASIGHTPDTTFGGLSWVNYSGGSALTLSAGFAGTLWSGGSAAQAGIDIGDTSGVATSYGVARIVDLQFLVRTGSHAVSNSSAQTSFSWWIEGVRFSVSISRATNVSAWTVYFENSVNASTTAIATALLDNTDYVGTVTMGHGVQTLVMFGQTFTLTRPNVNHSSGLSGMRLVVAEDMRIGYIQAFNNTARSEAASAALVAPMGVVRTYAGVQAQLSSPSGILRAVIGSDSNVFAGTAPMGVLGVRTGASSRISAPKGTLLASVIVPITVRADLTSPRGTLLATGTVNVAVNADLRLSSAGAVTAYFGGLATLTAPRGVLQAVVTTGLSSRFAASAPMGKLTALLSTGIVVRANLVAPMLRRAPYANAALVAPVGFVVALATAVFAVTYEAYAVNLKHDPRPGVEPNDEVTRYTNFPFNQIVRYQNSYYGVADNGLYLLGGATDLTTPVPWAFKTGMTDDKIPFKKRVTAARFAGRVGPAATVTLYTSEPDLNAYSYTTPRDADPQNYRQKFGRGTKARYYALGMAGTARLELDTIEPEVETLTRKL